MKRITLSLAAIIILFLTAQSQVQISIADTAILRGSTVRIPINVGTNLSGLNVFSYTLEIEFAGDAITIDSCISENSLTEQWGNPTFNINANKIILAGAGIQPLNGLGALVFVKVTLPPSSTWTQASLHFTQFMLNEGGPEVTTLDGTIFIINPPTITIYPDESLLTVGETKLFSVYGGTSPYRWYSTNPTVAAFNTTGELFGIHPGFCRVVVRDSAGIADSTQQVEVRSLKVFFTDTAIIQGRTFLLPVYTTDLSLINIFNGQFTVTYDGNFLTALATVEAGTLLQPFGQSTTQIVPGQIKIAFAGSSRLSGIGVQPLVYIQFKVTGTNRGSTNLSFADVIFNEGIPANTGKAYFTTLSTPEIYVNPNTATLASGDTLRFTANGGTLPLTWAVSDTTAARISTSGLLEVLKSGVVVVKVTDAVGVVGLSGNITLYDVRARVLNAQAVPGGTVDVGIR